MSVAVVALRPPLPLRLLLVPVIVEPECEGVGDDVEISTTLLVPISRSPRPV